MVATAEMRPIVETTYGALEGEHDGRIFRFRGIPYAAKPVGDLRFRPPQPPQRWDGVRSARRYGTVCMQNASPINQFFGEEPEPMDEDCLYLNVVTPGLDDARRPVMVWIHGGGFIMGSGSSPLYDGTEFARRSDIVFVSLNYRLGELGFLFLDELDEGYAGSGNIGILDQIAALEWVRDNISRFGGDPDNVTIFGESAGGMSVGTLLATPSARGLFHKAIAQSGAARNLLPIKVAAEVTDDFMMRAGARSVADLVLLPAERLLAIRAEVVAAAMSNLDRVISGDGPLLGLPFQPVIDGVVLPDDAQQLVRQGSAAGIPLLVGTTRDEWRLFGLMDMGDLDEEHLIRRAGNLVGDTDAFLGAYRRAFPEHSFKDLFGEIANDYAFRIPAIRLAEAQQASGASVWMYLFDWKSRAFGGMLGACHGIELPFVFHNVADPKLALFLGEGPDPDELADQVHDAWAAFAHHGDPNHGGLPEWPAYEPSRRATMRFAEPSEMLDDPLGATRRIWETII
jgi:para-nitrobenzyl esterase